MNSASCSKNLNDLNSPGCFTTNPFGISLCHPWLFVGGSRALSLCGPLVIPKSKKIRGSDEFYEPPGPLLFSVSVSAFLWLCERAWIINLAKIKSSAMCKPPVAMNNGMGSSTTGVWWVKHRTMMDGSLLHILHPSLPYRSTSGLPHPETQNTSTDNILYSLDVLLLSALSAFFFYYCFLVCLLRYHFVHEKHHSPACECIT